MPDSLLLVLWCVVVSGAAVLGHASATVLAGAEVAARVRFSIGLIGLLVAQYLIGLLLLVLGVFGSVATWSLVAGGAAALACLLRSAGVRAQLRADMNALSEALQTTSRAQLALLVLPVLLAWLQATRGIVTPPLDWDFLTYHGPRAAFWLQESTLWPSYDAVGLWQNYRAYSPAGDLITAWSMSVSGDDLLVAPTWTGVWLALGLGTYAAARSLAATRWHSVLAGGAIAVMPAAFQHMSSGYVDNAVALGVVTGTTCLAEAERRRNGELASFGLLGFAVAAAVKQTALPYLLIAFVLWLRHLFMARERLRVGVVAGVSSLALATGSLWYGVLALRTGNPLYPFSIALFGWQLKGPSDAIPAGWFKPQLDFLGAVRSLFFRGFSQQPQYHNGFGLGGLVLLVWGCVSLLARRRPAGLAAPALLLGGVVLLLSLMLRGMSDPSLDQCRYLFSVAVLAAIVVASSSPINPSVVLGASMAAALVYALPWRWDHIDVLPMGASIGVALLVGGTLCLMRRRAMALGLALLSSICCAAELRPALRSDYYRAAAEGKLMASGPIMFCPSSGAYRIWAELADASPMTIDVSAGDHPLLTHWYIYPLLGNDLQHRLVHVRTGLHFREQWRGLGEPELASSARAWTDGLRRAGARAVLLYKPYPIEAQLVARASSSFEESALDTPGATLFSLR